MTSLPQDAPQPEAARRSWYAGAPHWLFFAAAPIAAAGGAMALPALQGLAGALSLPVAPWRRISLQSWIFAALLLAFGGWVAASALWSQTPHSLQGARLLAALAFGLVFVASASAHDAARRRVRSIAAACMIVLAALLLIEAFGGMPINRIGQPDEPVMTTLARNPSRGVSVYLLMLWGAVACLAGGGGGERFAWRGLMIAAFALAPQFDMNANALAFGAGLIAYSCAYLAPRFTLGFLSSGVAGWLLVAPFVTTWLTQQTFLAQAPESWRARLEIWRFVCARIEERPLLGWGLDASRLHPEPVTSGGVSFLQIPLHPHSGSLQIWFETGLVGALLLALAIVVGGFSLALRLRGQRALAAAAAGSLATAGVVGNVSYGAWQEWWIAALFAAAAVIAASYRRSAATEDDP